MPLLNEFDRWASDPPPTDTRLDKSFIEIAMKQIEIDADTLALLAKL